MTGERLIRLLLKTVQHIKCGILEMTDPLGELITRHLPMLLPGQKSAIQPQLTAIQSAKETVKWDLEQADMAIAVTYC